MNDDFRGDNDALIRSIKALLGLDASGALVPHGIGGHARSLLSAAASRLVQPAASAEPTLWIQSNHVTCAQRMGPFMARVSGRKEDSDWLPLYTAPVAAQPSVQDRNEIIELLATLLHFIPKDEPEIYRDTVRLCGALRDITPPADGQAQQEDYERVISSHNRLVRKLDVLINGEKGAAKQASLCDIVSQVEAFGLRSGSQQDADIAAQPSPAMAGDEWLDGLAHMMVDLCMDDDAAAEIMYHARKRVQPGHTLGGSKEDYTRVFNMGRDSVQPASGDDARDAARYRWLRDEAETSPRDVFGTHWLVDLPEPVTLDSAIDAAMQQRSQHD